MALKTAVVFATSEELQRDLKWLIRELDPIQLWQRLPLSSVACNSTFLIPA